MIEILDDQEDNSSKDQNNANQENYAILSDRFHVTSSLSKIQN